MTDDELAKQRYFTIIAARLAGVAGAVFGLVLIGRADATRPKVGGVALVMAALVMIAVVPRSLAGRWRTPPEE